MSYIIFVTYLLQNSFCTTFPTFRRNSTAPILTKNINLFFTRLRLFSHYIKYTRIINYYRYISYEYYTDVQYYITKLK